MCIVLVLVEQARSRASLVWCHEAKYPVCFICQIVAALIWIYVCFSVGKQMCKVFQRLYVPETLSFLWWVSRSWSSYVTVHV